MTVHTPKSKSATPKSKNSSGKQRTVLDFFTKVPKEKALSPFQSKSPSSAADGSETPIPKDNILTPKSGVDKGSPPHRKKKKSPVEDNDENENGDDAILLDPKPSRDNTLTPPIKRSTTNGNDSTEDDTVIMKKQKRRRVVTIEEEEEEEEEGDDDDYSDDNDKDYMDDGADDDDDDVEVADVDDELDDEIGDDNEEAYNDEGSEKENSLKLTNGKDVKHAPRISLNDRFSASSTMVDYKLPRREAKKSSPKTKKPSTFNKVNEERYQWLEEVRDAEGRVETDPEYDPRTLYIPTSAWSKFTPFEKQYWEIKSKMWNTVVFFKKGKFYELYERDADIAHGEFDLKLAGGGRANMRLAGIPEMSFDYWASAFIEKGYKVAKVNQTETLLAKEMRGKAGGITTKEEKIIKRELSCVLTGGTLTDENMLVDDMSTYCMAIKQEADWFGICFVDTATGIFFFSEILDPDYVQFETIIAQTRPRELLIEKNGISKRAIKIVKNNSSPEAIWNYLSQSEFWGRDEAMEELTSGGYFEGKTTGIPEIVRKLAENEESSGVGISAFGALLSYLKSLKIAQELVSMGNFEEFNPKIASEIGQGRTALIDGQTLQNLDLLCNSEGGTEGSLLKFVNRAITPFGKRRVKEWLCHPLQDIDAINERYDVVEFWIQGTNIQEKVELLLSDVPDLERLLSRIHSGKLPAKDFVRTLKGFQSLWQLSSVLSDLSDVPNLLHKLLDSLPDLGAMLDKWISLFDWEIANSENIIVPYPNMEPDFDASKETVESIEQMLEEMLLQYRREFKTSDICYKDSGKEIYLIELPVKIKVPTTWQQMGATGKFKRYWSPEVRKLVRELQEARELHRVECESVQGKYYKAFDEDYYNWKQAVSVCADIDCLISLAAASKAAQTVRPELVPSSDDSDGPNKPVLEFDDLKHPCYLDFIPNEIKLGGGDSARICLLTGANAAGKSTLLRMTCVAVILAQMGCFVPCTRARFSPVDRVMTRLGAHDNIMAGKSTFFVELSETQRILSEATHRSLLVIDELGRGGSSSDGFAIAESVLHHIVTHIGSLGFFATHYATLSKTFESYPQIVAMRMAIMVDETLKRLTFLYKLEPGVAPGSFGMHVASMCGIDRSIVERAEDAAKEYEHTSRMKKLEASSSQIPLGLLSDVAWLANENEPIKKWSLGSLLEMIDKACQV